MHALRALNCPLEGGCSLEGGSNGSLAECSNGSPEGCSLIDVQPAVRVGKALFHLQEGDKRLRALSLAGAGRGEDAAAQTAAYSALEGWVRAKSLGIGFGV